MSLRVHVPLIGAAPQASILQLKEVITGDRIEMGGSYPEGVVTAGTQYDELFKGAMPSQAWHSKLFQTADRSEPNIALPVLKRGDRLGSVGE